MKPIKIMTDSCSDLTEDIRKRKDIISIDFTVFINGKEICADPWKVLKAHGLYGALRGGESIFTLPATEYEIRTKFKRYSKDYDILYIGACEKQSTTILKAKRVAEELMDADPNCRIEILDSLNASMGQGMVVLKACEFRDQGLPMEEIIEKTAAIRNNVVQFATVDTLTYLSRANKINARSATFGDLLDIKPILISDAEGKQTAMSRIKGRENSLNEIIRLFMENVTDEKDQEIYIIHGYNIASARAVEKELLRRGFNPRKITILCVGPVVGITTGPGMVGLFGFGKEVTFVGA